MLLGALLVARDASAQTVVFDIDEDRAQSLGLDARGIETNLTDETSVELNLVDPDGYLARFARAAAIAAKGMGVDYASHPKKFVVGASVGTAVSGIPLAFERDEDELPESGFAFMTSIHAGLNLGSFDAREQVIDRFTIYGSGMGFHAPSDFAFQATMYNLGLHVQIDAIRPVS